MSETRVFLTGESFETQFLNERLEDGGLLWEILTARLAQIADKNMPGWDAAEMATEALSVVRQALGL